MTAVVLVAADPRAPDELLATHRAELEAAGADVQVVDLRPAVASLARFAPRVIRSLVGGWWAACTVPRTAVQAMRGADLVVATDWFGVQSVWLRRRRTGADLVLGIPAAVARLRA